ncbi:MAG: IRE (iron responsive element) [Pirellulaceae bacterium]|nr:MAG: IRE (iron responsive element) [Pirellulaceae bacterium]
MNWLRPFERKIVYGALIVALLIPLFHLGQPASLDSSGNVRSGGYLALARQEHGLSQASLGEIDPASESMRLATLGLRGVAANLLWTKANEYKKKEDWDNLSAALNQITKLQPNFITVWEFQSHNLSYNVSAEFDDFRYRYHWVKKGIDFLIQGTLYNAKEPRLYHTVGWYFGQKIGRADEHRQFRDLFRHDRDYHATLRPYVDIESPEACSRHDQLPDNWLVGRLWYIKAQAIVDSGIRPLRGKSPLVFHSDRPKSFMNHAEAIEEEGHFGEVARAAWADGHREWMEFGNREIPSSWGINIRLNDYARVAEDVARWEAQLLSLAPQAREQIEKERREALTDEERQLLDTPLEQRIMRFTESQWQKVMEIEARMRISDEDICRRVPSDKRVDAERITRKLTSARTLLDRIDRYRNQVNFVYWKTRCEAEQTDMALQARQLMYQARRDWDRGNLEKTKEDLDQAWDLWAQLFEQYPNLKEDLAATDLKRSMELYRLTLSQLGEELPVNFKLKWLFDAISQQEPVTQDYVPVQPSPAPSGEAGAKP